MGYYAEPPQESTPVALRLVSRMLGWQPSVIVRFVTEPVEPGPNGNPICLLDVYQWSSTSQPTIKPVGVLKGLLVECSAEKTEAEALAAIPANLFVYSNQLAAAYQEAMGGPGQLDDGDRVDWNPNVSGIKALIEECPEPLRLGKEGVEQHGRTRREGKRQTAERYQLWQKKFCELWREALAKASRRDQAKPQAIDICTEIQCDPRLNPRNVSAATIERRISVGLCR